MDGQDVVGQCDKIVDQIKSQYDCKLEPGYFIDSCYIFGKTTNFVTFQEKLWTFITLSFKIRVNISDDDLRMEIAKFDIKKPSDQHMTPYRVLSLRDEEVTSYYIWAWYRNGESLTWRKYTVGDRIIGDPQVRKEVNLVQSTGKAGSIMAFKMLRSDLIEKPLNILYLERFMNKYAVLKPSSPVEIKIEKE